MLKVNVKVPYSRGKTQTHQERQMEFYTLTPVDLLMLLCEEGNLFPDLVIYTQSTLLKGFTQGKTFLPVSHNILYFLLKGEQNET